MSRQPSRVMRIEIVWFDIEDQAGWGEIGNDVPLVTQIGYLHSRPRKNQKVPCWQIKKGQSEDEPIGLTRIPAVNVVKVTELGWTEVPWRKNP